MLELFTSTRLQILLKLSERPHTVTEIAKITGFSKTTISYHLEKLEENGLVERVERGKWVYYRLTSKGLSKMKIEAFATLASISVAIISFTTLVAKIMQKFVEKGEFRPAYVPETPAPTRVPEMTPVSDVFLSVEVFLAIVAVVALVIFLYLKTR
ncbi:MAG: winged helix-turn-helix domain-containing protein [Archaeoglobaceae archaeon]